MMENYYVISNSEGDTTVEEMSKEKLIERLEEGYYGGVDSLISIPENNDTNYWGNNILIIKGSIVRPKEKKVVTKYNID